MLFIEQGKLHLYSVELLWSVTQNKVSHSEIRQVCEHCHVRIYTHRVHEHEECLSASLSSFTKLAVAVTYSATRYDATHQQFKRYLPLKGL